MAYLKTGNEENKEDIQLILRRDATYQVNRHQISILKGHEHVVWHVELIQGNLEEKTIDFQSNVEGARKWGESYYKKWKPELSSEEQNSIENYTGGGYNEINLYLSKPTEWKREYGKGSEEKIRLQEQNLQKKINTIDKAIDKASVPEAIIVYRRVSEWQFNRESMTLRENTGHSLVQKVKNEIIAEFQGKTFTQHSYMSTSLAKDPHKSFTGERFNILLVIHIPKGTRAAYVANMGKYPEQLELLIKRGYTFKYEKFSVIKDANSKESLMVEVSLQL
ncbi:TPA: ADP-ribosyltransferase [Bacillus cereus]|nr:ADP-ribosyltransferase [Bacillus cereus]